MRSYGFFLASWIFLGAAESATSTNNVILITLDGVRIQELFAGMDPVIAGDPEGSGIYDLARARSKFWRPSAEERREALMPFFWKRLAPQGVVLGNREKGSRVLVKNPLLFSAPGYIEILTGRPQPDVVTNELIRYPHATVLELVQRELELAREEVAVIGSWEGFGYLSSSRPDVFFTNCGYEAISSDIATPRMSFLSGLQTQIMTLWETGRSDAVTFGIALEYLKEYRPRFLYIALSESDDWSHARRYDRLLDYLQIVDTFLDELWSVVESMEFYRERTTLVITTDHGRGVSIANWVTHEEGIAGAEDIWVAVIGPDTPDRGELAPSPTIYQSDVAATVMRLFGLDEGKLGPAAGPPIRVALADDQR